MVCGPWEPLTWPLPKSHDHVTGPPVEVSVKVTDRGAGPFVGVASNDAVGAVPVAVGAALSCAVAFADSARSWEPKIAPRNGVSSVIRPVTATLIVWPRLALVGQVPVEHETLTSAGATVTNPPLASLSVRHMIRFDSLFADVQAVPARKEVGLREPSMAPSRAASLTVICE